MKDALRDSNDTDRLISSATVVRLTGLSRMSVWRLEKAGKFPRRVKIGERRVAWLLSEVLAWMAERLAERDGDDR